MKIFIKLPIKIFYLNCRFLANFFLNSILAVSRNRDLNPYTAVQIVVENHDTVLYDYLLIGSFRIQSKQRAEWFMVLCQQLSSISGIQTQNLLVTSVELKPLSLCSWYLISQISKVSSHHPPMSSILKHAEWEGRARSHPVRLRVSVYEHKD